MSSKGEEVAVLDDTRQELPELTLANLWGDFKQAVYYLIFDHEFNVFIIPTLVMLESIACKFIYHKFSYTEIDYTAYMEQIEKINDGELNYDNIYGGTGPLVYPAGHVWIYKLLYYVTSGTKNIEIAQMIFGWIYSANISLVMLVYFNMSTPPWVIYLLFISKRLHSIYVLRLFNDVFTTFFAVITVISLQYAGITKKSNPVTSKALTNLIAPFFYALAISVKMNALLYLPGFLLITYFLNEEILVSLIAPFTVICLANIGIAYEFLFNGEVIRDSYLAGAYNFKRKFLYEWTVNWRFLSEERFNDDSFHHLLLIIQVGLLLFFLFTKWAAPSATGKSTSRLIIDGLKIFKPTLSPSHIITDTDVGPRYICGVLMSCNLIGIICSRSLHYQFLSWYAWTFPYMLYRATRYVFIAVPIALAHEWCWNMYPSTKVSSIVLLTINSVVLVGYLFSTDKPTLAPVEKDKKDN